MAKKTSKEGFKPNLALEQPQSVPVKESKPKPRKPREDDASVLTAKAKTRSTDAKIPLSSVGNTVRKKRRSTTETAIRSKTKIEINAAIKPEAPERWSFVASTGRLATALALWAFGLGGVDPARLDDFGIVSILTLPIWTALVLTATGFVLSLRPKLVSGPLPLLHLVALVVMLHATPAIVYETARYSWAWKHLGIVDFVQRHGNVEPAIDLLPVYHNWPGLFIVTAWLANALGIRSIELANAIRFVPPVLNLLFLFALIPIYRRFTGDPRLIWTAAWIFLVGNWIGQDYFSPQGVAFFMYLVVLGLCLGPLHSNLEWTQYATGRLRRHAAAFVTFVSSRSEPAPQQVGGLGRMASSVCVLLLICAIIVTHQLTPIALILALAGLAAVGRVGIGYCFFAIVAEVLWLLYFATPFVADNLTEELNLFGQGLFEASDRLINTSLVTQGQVYVVVIGRLTTAVIAITAIIGGVRRLVYGYRDGSAAVLAVSAFALFANSYGGEILFRVYFFSLPFLAFFAAAAFFPTTALGGSHLLRAFLGCFGLLLAIGFLFANNGKDRQYTFSPTEVDAAYWLYRTAPPGTLLIEGARSYPGQFLNYENFTYVPISLESTEQRIEIVNDPVNIFARWLGDPKWQAGFVIITRSQKAYLDAEGIMPQGSLDRIEQALLTSPRFVVTYATADARIFALHPTVGKMGPWAR